MSHHLEIVFIVDGFEIFNIAITLFQWELVDLYYSLQMPNTWVSIPSNKTILDTNATINARIEHDEGINKCPKIRAIYVWLNLLINPITDNPKPDFRY